MKREVVGEYTVSAIVPSTETTYPVTSVLSVEASQEKTTEFEPAVICKLDGAEGASVSGLGSIPVTTVKVVTVDSFPALSTAETPNSYEVNGESPLNEAFNSVVVNST